QLGGPVALDYSSGVDARLTVRFEKTAAITHQTTGNREVPRLLNCRHPVAHGESSKLFAVCGEHRVGSEHKARRALLGQLGKYPIEVLRFAGALNEQIEPAGRSHGLQALQL